MMQPNHNQLQKILPGRVSGLVAAPSSKSVAQRALLLAHLSNTPTQLVLTSYCEDIENCARAIGSLGSEVTKNSKGYLVRGQAHPPYSVVSTGESGTCMRMIVALAALGVGEISIEGSGTLASRPMTMIEAPLMELGVRVQTTEGHSPIIIRGPINGGIVHVDGSMSSQFLSGLLIALAACPEPSTILVTNLKSRPYVELTLQVLSDFGCHIIVDKDFSRFDVPKSQHPHAAHYEVEGDWSGAAALLVAGALCSDVEVTGLRSDSLQADKKLLEALRSSGAIVDVVAHNTICVSKDRNFAFEFDAEHCPDLMPVLVALACGCEGVSRLKGAKRLKHKESDRAAALSQEFSKIGGKVSVQDDYLIVEGSKIKGGSASSHADHRIAMALAIAGLQSENGVEIQEASSVNKSYPEFFEHLDKLRAHV